MRSSKLLTALGALALCAACSSTPQATKDSELAEQPTPEAKDDTDTTNPEEEPVDPDAPMKWVWEDYEVVGHQSVTRAQILEDLPFAVGDEASREPETVKTINVWCNERRKALGVYAMKCGFLRFGDGKSYVVVNVLEEADAKRLVSREKPSGDQTIPAELDALMERHDTILEGHFDSGNYKVLAEEVARPDSGDPYLTYPKEPALAAIAEELAAKAPAHRDALIDALTHAESAEVRGRAATLLNWAGEPTESVRVAHVLLDDPSSLVRNNLTRFMLHFIPDIDDLELQGSLARVLAIQTTRPSHGDRNKALYGLLYLAKSSQGALAIVMEEAGGAITRLAQQSRLPNVGDVAKEILALGEDE